MAPDDGAGLNSAKDILALAAIVLKARLAAAAGQDTEAIRLLGEAVAKEDQLAYDEPADWFIPVRHQLGAALLKGGQAQAAEAVYREDLRRHPANGWSLFGLAQALRSQGRARDAAAAQADFDKAWAHADVTLSRSAL
jgi:tetratricopeptide (TPR) repeat protein